MAKRTVKLTKAEMAKLAVEYVERDRLIALLGMAPEDRSSYDTRYCYTTGELRRDAIKEGLLAV
jgi:hypothetical protein